MLSTQIFLRRVIVLKEESCVRNGKVLDLVNDVLHKPVHF